MTTPPHDRCIWVDGWQMACCGESFTVGSRVEWAVTPVVDHDFLKVVLGPELSAQITHAEERHSDVDHAVLQPLAGVVRSIDAVNCRYEGRGEAASQYPVPGTVVLTSTETAGTPGVTFDGLVFLGWIVRVGGATRAESPSVSIGVKATKPGPIE